MKFYHIILLISFIILLINIIRIFVKIILKKEIENPATPKGNYVNTIKYSYIGSMSPTKKETAYMHLPTYISGMIFHIGTFLSLLWIVLLFFNINFNILIEYFSIFILLLSSLCGIGILFKRIILSKLRNFSIPDDYISNILVTGFQAITLITIYNNNFLPVLFIYSSILLLYIPISKLRHCIYFFSARIFLAKFYGKRGVWPSK